MEDAAAGSWIALAGSRGQGPRLVGRRSRARFRETRRPGTLAVRWSATRFELLHWRVAGAERSAGVVCAGRSLPVGAPEFARALDLEGPARTGSPRRPASAARAARDHSGGGAHRGRPTDVPIGTEPPVAPRGPGAPLRVGLWLVFGPSGWIGAGLAVLFLTARAAPAEARDSGVADSLASRRRRRRVAGGTRASAARGPDATGLRVAGGYALFAAALVAARRVVVPDLGSPFSLTERSLPVSRRPDRSGGAAAGARGLGSRGAALARVDELAVLATSAAVDRGAARCVSAAVSIRSRWARPECSASRPGGVRSRRRAERGRPRTVSARRAERRF